MNEPKYALATEMRKKDGAQNQDCGAAERLLMADGNFAYVAAIADGVSCCEMPREAASLAISHFRRAFEDTSLQELAEQGSREQWLASWTAVLEDDVRSRVRDGYATFCAIAVVPFPGESGYGVLSLNVGDSSSFLVSAADSRCVSMKPSDGGRRNSGDDGLVRGVGLSHRDGPLMDMDWRTYPAGFSGYFWVGCDGVFNYVAGSDLREISLGGQFAFRELPQAALALSLDEGRRQGKKSLDNATAAVVGVNVAEGPAPIERPLALEERGRLGAIKRIAAAVAGLSSRIWLALALLAVAAAVALWLGSPRRAHVRHVQTPPQAALSETQATAAATETGEGDTGQLDGADQIQQISVPDIPIDLPAQNLNGEAAVPDGETAEASGGAVAESNATESPASPVDGGLPDGKAELPAE